MGMRLSTADLTFSCEDQSYWRLTVALCHDQASFSLTAHVSLALPFIELHCDSWAVSPPVNFQVSQHFLYPDIDRVGHVRNK